MDFMAIHRMSTQEFGNTLNNVTRQIQSTQGKKEGFDATKLLQNVQNCNEFLENKVKLPETINKNIEKFLAAANLFLLQYKGDKTTQEKMGQLISSLSPISDVEKLRKNLLKRQLVKKDRYGSKIEAIEKARDFKKK